MSEQVLVKVSQQWAEVFRENESQRHLVNESDWGNWERIRDEWNPFVMELLESDRPVTEPEVEQLGRLSRIISGARRVPCKELEAKLAPVVPEKSKAKRRGILGLLMGND